MAQKERERKLVLLNLPTEQLRTAESYWQGYVPNPVGLALRVRREGEKLVLQLKLRDPVSDDPYESPKLNLTDVAPIFDRLVDWVRTADEPNEVIKERYTLSAEHVHGAKEIIIDVFRGPLDGHLMAEVEFDTPEEKANWQIPQWMIECGYREVTGDERYNNEQLGQFGWPEEV